MISYFKRSSIRTILLAFVFTIPFVFLTGCGSSSDNDDGDTGGIPLTSPKSISITPKDTELHLVWTGLAPVQDVSANYEVRYSTNEDMSNPQTIDVNASGNYTTTTIEGLTNGTKYYLQVRAIYESIGEAEYSSIYTASPIDKPTKPTNLKAYSLDSMIDLTWDGVASASSYSIAWKKDAPASDTPPDDALINTVTKTGMLIEDVSNNDTYRIWVKAINTAGDSTYESITATATAATTLPTAPNAGEITPASKSLVVHFDAAKDATSYTLKYATSDNIDAQDAKEQEVQADSQNVTAIVSDLENGQSYFVWVRANNSLGSSEFTPLSNAAPASRAAVDPIDFEDITFDLGTSTAQYIWAENTPVSLLLPADFKVRPYDRLSRVKETAIGDLFCDGAAWYIRNTLNEEVDFTFLNGGYINGAIAQGEITLKDIIATVDPDSLEDKLVLLSLSGEDVIKLFKSAAAVNHTGHGGKNTGPWAMVSQEVRYTIRYNELDETLTELTSEQKDAYYSGWINFDDEWRFNGEKIDANKTYRIATTSWLASGQDGYLAFLNATNKVEKEEYFYQAVSHYIYEMNTITPSIDGRVSIVGGVPLLPPYWVASDGKEKPRYDNTPDGIYPEYKD